MSDNDNMDQSLWRGRGRIEYLGDPDDGSIQLVGNAPEMSVVDLEGVLMEYVYDPASGRMTYLPKDP